LRISQPVTAIFARYHHSLAFASFVVLTFHGILALLGKHGWQWGKLLSFRGDIATGVISWLELLAVVVLAMFAVKQKPFSRTHCWLVVLPIIAILFHIS